MFPQCFSFAIRETHVSSINIFVSKVQIMLLLHGRALKNKLTPRMLADTRKDHSIPLIATGRSLFESDKMSSVLDSAKFDLRGIRTSSLSCPDLLRIELPHRRFKKKIQKVTESCS